MVVWPCRDVVSPGPLSNVTALTHVPLGVPALWVGLEDEGLGMHQHSRIWRPFLSLMIYVYIVIVKHICDQTKADSIYTNTLCPRAPFTHSMHGKSSALVMLSITACGVTRAIAGMCQQSLCS